MSMSHVDEGTLHAYIDGELPPAEAQGVAEHLAHCPVCRGRVEEERALIARADQVLALARPPERDLPAFRAGAQEPPVRWWRPVPAPLAWAATVVLALGIGIYVGRAGTGRVIAPALAPSPAPFASGTPAADSVRAPTQHIPPSPRAQAAPVAHPVRAVARAPRQFAPSDTPARSLTRARDELAANETIAAEAKRMGYAIGAGAGDLVLGAPLSLDSARALLDADPLAVPGLAVRAVHQGRMPGYSAVVVVEQVLDSGTTLAVITARPTVSALGEVGVAGAPPPAKATPSEGAGIARERAPDSLASRGRQSSARAVPRSDTRAAGLWLDVRGPLAADSLAALRRRLEPLRP
jgi:anti-sigma factor RsiW